MDNIKKLLFFDKENLVINYDSQKIEIQSWHFTDNNQKNIYYYNKEEFNNLYASYSLLLQSFEFP